MPNLQPQFEEMQSFEFGFNPDNKQEVKARKERMDDLDLKITEINFFLEGINIEKLNIEESSKQDLKFIKNNIMKLASIKDSPEFKIHEAPHLADRLGAFETSLPYIHRINKSVEARAAFFQTVKKFKKYLSNILYGPKGYLPKGEEMLKEELETYEGYTIH